MRREPQPNPNPGTKPPPPPAPPPRELAKAVGRMRYDAHASQSNDGRVVVGQDDLDTVLDALAEAQRERDNAMGHAKQEGELRDAAEAELATLRVRNDSATCVAALQVLTAERDAAQAEAAKLREALVRAKEHAEELWGYCDGWYWKYGDAWREEFAAIDAALAAPPSTAATPPTVPAGRYIFRKKFDDIDSWDVQREGEDCERAFSVTLREAIAAITTAATPEGK